MKRKIFYFRDVLSCRNTSNKNRKEQNNHHDVKFCKQRKVRSGTSRHSKHDNCNEMRKVLCFSALQNHSTDLLRPLQNNLVFSFCQFYPSLSSRSEKKEKKTSVKIKNTIDKLEKLTLMLKFTHRLIYVLSITNVLFQIPEQKAFCDITTAIHICKNLLSEFLRASVFTLSFYRIKQTDAANQCLKH